MSFSEILASAVVFPLFITLAGCEGKKEEGPAERAGKQLDEAASALGKSIEDAGKNIRDAVSSAK